MAQRRQTRECSTLRLDMKATMLTMDCFSNIILLDIWIHTQIFILFATWFKTS